MNAINSGRTSKTRSTRSFKLAPTTRAIRTALAVSATVLALAGSGVAFAGTCNVTALNTVSCNGVFTQTVPGGIFVPTVDLTLVLGDNAPTSVTPAAGNIGVDASWGGNVGVVSYADITTDGADGIHEYGSTSATLTNHGGITTHVTAAGVNAVDISAYGDVTLVNTDAIYAYATGAYSVTAVTAYSSNGNVSIDNQDTGSITASSTGGSATALFAQADIGDVNVSNSGSISAAAGNYVSGTGVNIDAGGNAVLDNSGSISASAGNYGTATGVHVVGDESATVTNSGSISVDGATAYGVWEYSHDGLSTVINDSNGTIVVDGGSSATGIRAGGYNGDGYVYNAGDIEVTAYNGKYSPTSAVGIKAADVVNSGDISVVSDGPLGSAKGIYSRAYGGDTAYVNNSGDITLGAAGFLADETGIGATGTSVDIINSGDIDVEATSDGTKYGLPSYARGIDADAIGDVYVGNSGNIVTGAVFGSALGIKVFSESYSEIINSGSISATGIGATGITVFGDSVAVSNSGSIEATGNSAFGISSLSGTVADGAGVVDNSGDITVNAAFQAHGVNVYVDYRGYGDATFTNSGTISSNTRVDPGAYYAYSVIGGAAYGVNVVDFMGDTVVDNSGSIEATLYSYSAFANGLGRYQAGATGLLDYGHTGDIDIVNSGSITASSEVRSNYFGTQATGVKVIDDFGDVNFENTGTTSATAISDYRSDGGQTLATGVLIDNFRGITTITNGSAGDISAYSSTVLYDTAAAIGIHAYTVAGSMYVSNAGEIHATAESGATSYVDFYGETTATGVLVSGPFATLLTVDNDGTGSITATALADSYGAANATGISGSIYYGSVGVTNAGAITATATADGHSDIGDAAFATGVLLSNSSPIYGATTTLSNSSGGVIAANASAYSLAQAEGVSISGADVDVTSAGSISATATADSDYGTALATGLYAYGSDVTVSLGASSVINATAGAYEGTAIGLSVYGDIVTASNAGAINAQFNGAGGNTYGAVISSSGDVSFTNSGHITATDADYAVGVELNSTSVTTLINSGAITASSTAAGSIAVLTGDSTDSIDNTGTINGALLTNGGNDTLNNNVGGIWNVIGDSTTFGSGDDTINNAGTIRLADSSISLGSYDTLGNTFLNSGTITVSGDSSIDMGTGPDTVLPSLNPNPFANSGTIDFRNGVVTDTLTVLGDWAGSGDVWFDVSGLHGTGDQLYIDGNVTAGSVTSVDVNMLDLPTTASSEIPVVFVSGDSTAGSFVLGDVHFNQNTSFLTLDFGVSLLSDIDASNATPDVFSVAVAVTGLSDNGTLAASFAPGVQSLMNSQVGTWRERMGAINESSKHGLSLWTRFFQDKGTVDPIHTADNFGQGGNFAFNQKNSGMEVGADFAFSDEFSAGLLLGKAEARQNLEGDGVGSSKINGDTVGVYGTWISQSGFYLDGSYRRMNFDARLDSAAGETRTKGKADTFNFELGYDWILDGGLKIEPQLQYSRTKVSDVDTLTGALTGFNPESGNSSRARLGVLLTKDFKASAGGTVWSPYVAVSAVREFDGKNGFIINNNFSGETSTEGTSALVEGGLAVQVGKLSVFGGLNWQDGGALKSVVGGELGVRYTW
jgi:outer membrane autotransporter protein